MIQRTADGNLQYITADGAVKNANVFDPIFGELSSRMSAQTDAARANAQNLANYNTAVDNMQISVNNGMVYDPRALPAVPQMTVVPDDPTLPLSTQPFPPNLLHALHAAPVTPTAANQGGLGPNNPNRTATPLDPAIQSQFDMIKQMLTLIYEKVNK